MKNAESVEIVVNAIDKLMFPPNSNVHMFDAPPFLSDKKLVQNVQ